MLLGRDDERLALDRLLAEARRGHGGAVGLVGEPGIGKTMLLDYAAEQADGMRVLRARGIESEAEIPFGGLAELLRPCLPVLGQIPAPQSSALAGALALGPASAADRYAIGAATLSLLSASADSGPLLLLVDDAHWLDESSAQALVFAARRLLADPIAAVFAARDGERSLLDGTDLRVIRLAGLGRAMAGRLLAEANLPADEIDALVRATGGNPLALLELGSAGVWLGGATPAEPVRISTRIATAFLHRFGRLPEATRSLLVVAAASDDGDLAVLARAAAALGLDVADLVAAEDAGLVTLDRGQVAFSHPLARAAMYANASARERRQAHAAMAAALPEHDGDRRAWHHAAASLGPNDAVAESLRAAGARARERSAYAVAAAAFERGAGLASEDELRCDLLLAAADAAWLAGDARRTLAALDDARRLGVDPLRLTRIDHLRGQVALRRGPVTDGYPLIADAAARISPADPELAVVMLAQAVLGCFYAGDTPTMLTLARRAVELAGAKASRRAQFLASVAQGIALVADGQGSRGAAAIRWALGVLEQSDDLRDDPGLLVWATVGPLWLREAGVGRAVIDHAFDRARSTVAVGTLPSMLHMFARDQATTDRWAVAEASYDEAVRLARETGQRVELGAALAGLACLEARQGRDSACRGHAAEAAALCDELGIGFYGAWAVQAIGDLELAQGNPAAATVHHEAQAEVLRRHGVADVDLSPIPELVDAYVRLGNTDRAAELAADFRHRAEAKQQPWALARAARCAGLLASNDAMQDQFDEALRLHALTPDTFEEARTRLAFGARLRRARHRLRARDELRAALERFERLGAKPWADQCDTELAATGETARRRDVSTLTQLTPQEGQIARLLAAGKTTREAAAAIFVSPKTVEYHLRHVYEKLGIRSRDELVAALGTLDR
jgi:DNA-binding CsgD family transcriptional regulator